MPLKSPGRAREGQDPRSWGIPHDDISIALPQASAATPARLVRFCFEDRTGWIIGLVLEKYARIGIHSGTSVHRRLTSGLSAEKMAGPRRTNNLTPCRVTGLSRSYIPVQKAAKIA